MSSRGAETCTTSMVVEALKISAMWLSRLGARCMMITMAMPLSGGIAARNLLHASSPPADAPMPTTNLGLSALTSGPAFVVLGTSSAGAHSGIDLKKLPPSPGPPT